MSASDDPAAEIARLAALTGTRSATASGMDDGPPPPPSGYFETTRTATYGYVAALPLFVLYEAGVLLANSGPGQIRVGADVWLKTLLAAFGATGFAALGVAVVAIGGVVWWRERLRRPPLVARYFGGIVVEALVYAVVLAVLVGGAIGALFGTWALPTAALAQLARLGLGLQLALSIGAGLYEELVFRVLLVGGLFWVLQRVTVLGQRRSYLVAAVIGAVVFSAVHHLGPLGDPFTVSVFAFRFLFGLALNAVFLARGFALAAWTHALYDVLVVAGGL